MFMLTSNLFRALHPLKSHDAESFDMDEEEPNLEPAWPHLQVCLVVRAREGRGAIGTGERGNRCTG